MLRSCPPVGPRHPGSCGGWLCFGSIAGSGESQRDAVVPRALPCPLIGNIGVSLNPADRDLWVPPEQPAVCSANLVDTGSSIGPAWMREPWQSPRTPGRRHKAHAGALSAIRFTARPTESSHQTSSYGRLCPFHPAGGKHMSERFRLVTRSDFDALVCAASLKELNMIDDVLFAHPQEMQNDKVEIGTKDITTNLPTISIHADVLGRPVPGPMVYQDHAFANRATGEGRENAARSTSAAAQLLSGHRPTFQRRRGRRHCQGATDLQKNLRISNLTRNGNRALSCTWRSTRTAVHLQISLTSQEKNTHSPLTANRWT